jgi:DNA-binding NtrC family response regulator
MANRVLLVVDDEIEIGKLFERIFGARFDEIHVCSRVEDAEAVLAHHPVTHVVSDNYLGPGQPLGEDVLPEWRRSHPSIRFTAIFTGSSVPARMEIPGVDEVYYKPTGFEALVERLAQGG